MSLYTVISTEGVVLKTNDIEEARKAITGTAHVIRYSPEAILAEQARREAIGKMAGHPDVPVFNNAEEDMDVIAACEDYFDQDTCRNYVMANFHMHQYAKGRRHLVQRLLRW